MKKRTVPFRLLICSASLVISILSLYFSWNAEQRAYRRVVADLWQTLSPMYEDLGIAPPVSPPTTVQEALAPLTKPSKKL